MVKHRKISATLLTSSCVLVALQSGGAIAAADPPTHLYSMNEPPGASVMVDTGRVPVNGSIGTEVDTGVVFAGATGYRFERLTPNTPPAHPQHLVTIPDAPSIDPGTSAYTIEIRYRTTNKFGNLIQKGQAATKGGQFKIQLPQGRPTCYFKGSLGRVGTGSPTAINDGAWHTLRCTRTASAVDFFVDGVRVGHKNGPSGLIDNKLPLSIAGKPNCDQIEVTCDYFGGDIDYVRIEKG